MKIIKSSFVSVSAILSISTFILLLISNPYQADKLYLGVVLIIFLVSSFVVYRCLNER